ncbi:hypothetical protein AVEN_272294-1 [Araneus ventricosus]|uniref:Mos1 transposase HTH domain-containing protein n=2 Tax=Araneus ventricosus TaxID=182803 RepID=A0A4Y2UJE4_ARAVE|nr:hypothetical protein AVEN_272294-1 [Araneus ventricosus]
MFAVRNPLEVSFPLCQKLELRLRLESRSSAPLLAVYRSPAVLFYQHVPDCVVFTCVSERSKCRIADPADCEVRSVIRFSNAKKVKPAEIHRQLVEIYIENVMTDGMVRKWVRQFNDGRTNVHDEARSGRPSVVNDGLVAKVNEKIRENRRFTIRMLFDEFPEISKTVLHEIVTNRLNYRKLCSRWVPKMLTDVHKTK